MSTNAQPAPAPALAQDRLEALAFLERRLTQGPGLPEQLARYYQQVRAMIAADPTVVPPPLHDLALPLPDEPASLKSYRYLQLLQRELLRLRQLGWLGPAAADLALA